MRTLFGALRDRLLPAVLTAAGVTLIAAGLLNYGNGAVVAAADPSGGVSAAPTIFADSPDPTVALLPSLPPINASAPPASLPPTATPNPNRVATRVVVEALGIDLPVIRPRGSSSTYPQCNVAM